MATNLMAVLLPRLRIKNPANVPFLSAFEKTLRSSIVLCRYVIQRCSIGDIGTYDRFGSKDEFESNSSDAPGLTNKKLKKHFNA